MGLHRNIRNDNKKRDPNELWWDTINNGHVVMKGSTRIRGWLLRLADHLWVARNESGTVRAEFDTFEEARDFIWAIVNMESKDGV